MHTIFSKNLLKIAGLEEKKTPYYIYDLGLLRSTVQEIKKSIPKERNFQVHYAIKANHDKKVLQLLASEGFGADCVSGNEIKESLQTGFKNTDIVFAGVGKTDEEIMTGIRSKIACFNVESIEEIHVINEISKKKGVVSQISIRINPNIDPQTHSYITTGKEENKFGISFSAFVHAFEEIQRMSHISFQGFHYHLGSQISDFSVFESLAKTATEHYKWVIEKGGTITSVNVGGGLGINYEFPRKTPIADFKSYFSTFSRFLGIPKSIPVNFELGRSVIGQCGVLVTSVLYSKKAMKKTFLVCDAGMTEILRPSLYNAEHKVESLSSYVSETETYDVVGPICETSDFIRKGVSLPISKRGDKILVFGCGAYCQVMRSNYNLRENAKTYYV